MKESNDFLDVRKYKMNKELLNSNFLFYYVPSYFTYQ